MEKNFQCSILANNFEVLMLNNSYFSPGLNTKNDCETYTFFLDNNVISVIDSQKTMLQAKKGGGGASEQFSLEKIVVVLNANTTFTRNCKAVKNI